MIITRTSPVSGKTATMEIDVTQNQLDNWESGQLIQNAMPNLTPDEREFILTGITPEEWDSIFGDEVCHECGGKNPVWFTDNHLWNLVMGGPDCMDDPGGILCPTCFIFRAEAAGMKPPAWMIYWSGPQ